MSLEDQFRRVGNDGISYRGAPFWSWNDLLDPDELSRQIREMAQAGLGGHFMHAREGLITEYMGPQWMAAIKAAVRASKEAGIKAWLYDENCWPSGSAGGAIPARSEEYEAKALSWEDVPPEDFKPGPHTVATFLVRATAGAEPDIRPVDAKLAQRKAEPGERLLHFYYKKPWTRLQPTYTDLLHRKAVREFIHHTYSGYRKAVGREFRKTIPGIFTDEPQWMRIPWSTELPAAFKKANGYDLLPSLPMLALDVGDFRAFRYDFWRTATELFVDSFTRQIGEWCGQRGLLFTGHMNAENSLRSQIGSIGAAMPHYEHMQMPGIDHLCRCITDPLLCKQVSSVAHQFGGRRVLSEMFGCSGWNVSFEELKWIAEWQFVLGVDFVCQHLSLYSARGCRKRDYPPSLHYQQPWWNDYRLLNDYFARLTFLLTRGKHVADVLVLHNIESAWTQWSRDDAGEVEALNRKLVQLSRALLGLHYDFDFGDESILARHGRVAQGGLRVKSCRYRVVVVPPCVTLRRSTVALLKRFLDRGGVVLLAGGAPGRMDGRPSEKPAEVLARAVRVKLSAPSLRAALRKALEPRIEVFDAEKQDAADVYVQQRDLGDRQVYFLANIRREQGAAVTVRLPGSGRLERWDPATGEVEPLKTRRRGRMLETSLAFEPMGSHLLVLSKRRRPATVRTRKPTTVERISLTDAWSLERSDPNALTLDYCSYRIADGEWSAPMPVLDVQNNLRHIEGSQVCEFKYTFAADFSAKLPPYLHLVVEEPEAYEIVMNGRPVGPAQEGEAPDLGWWRDISFRRLDVSHFLKPQDTNEIILRRVVAGEAERKRLMNEPDVSPEEKNRLRYGTEIESVYILGEFLVRSAARFKALKRRAVRTPGGFVLTDNWAQVTTGDLVQQGLPFYAGSVRLEQALDVGEKALRSARGAVLAFDPPDAIVTKVYVNGRLAGTRAWRPYEFEIGELLVPGRNEVAVELVGSCRNLLGPHHHVDGELYSVGPFSFRSARSWTDRADAPDRIWTDAYSFVRFGLTGPVVLTLWK